MCEGQRPHRRSHPTLPHMLRKRRGDAVGKWSGLGASSSASSARWRSVASRTRQFVEAPSPYHQNTANPTFRFGLGGLNRANRWNTPARCLAGGCRPANVILFLGPTLKANPDEEDMAQKCGAPFPHCSPLREAITGSMQSPHPTMLTS